MSTRPNFAVVGAARAGTTALCEAIRAHPHGFLSHPKEPHFLALGGARPAFTGPGDEAGINAISVTEQDRYLELFGGSERATARGEGSVSSLYYAETAAPRLAGLAPEAKVVVCLRDPVDRAFSSWQYLRALGHEPEDDFATALGLEPERIAAGWHHLWHYRGVSTYLPGVAGFLRHFPREQVLVLTYDELQANPHGTLTTLFNFLGLQPIQGEGLARVNSSGEVRSASVQRALSRLREVPVIRGAVKSVLPYAVRERIRQANLRTTSVDPQLRRVLSAEFAPDLAAVEELLAQRLPAWGR